MKIFNFFLLIISVFVFSSCDKKPVPENLPSSVKSEFNLLQDNPQFVMYMNFKEMRNTEFWKTNISDSVLNAERTFGSMLATFKEATGASLSEGLDEIYLSNSWTGENAVILKGIFNKDKLYSFLKNDTTFTENKRPEGIIYMHKENHLFFFFKDNFTICASNHPSQIDKMLSVRDTSKTGLLTNDKFMNAIELINFKSNVWLVSTEKTFIRGIFMNFVESKFGERAPDMSREIDTLFLNENPNADTLSETDKIIINKLHERINSISFSGRMKNDFTFAAQIECTDEKSATYLNNLITGLISLSKLNLAIKKEENFSAMEKLLNDIKVNSYENSVQINVKITNENINDFRKYTLFRKSP